jgi:hypothetical protein
MSLADDIREAIGIARTETLDLHVTVTHHAWIGQSFDGSPQYLDVQRLAIVERKQKIVRNLQTGQQDVSNTYIGLLEEIAPTTPNPGYLRTNPVDVDDTFTLSDGTLVTVLAVDGFFDGGTGVPFYSQVWGG